MKKILFSFFLLAVTATQLNAQCSVCTPVDCSVQKPTGGLCNQAPDDTAGQPYDAVISFYAPRVLTDPTTLAQCSGCSYVELHHLKIVGIQGLPTGVSATPNHANGYYDVWAGDTSGCVHFCGTPVAPGVYYVIVNLLADVVAVGTPIGNVTVNGQAQTYRDTIEIFPGTSECPQSFTIGNGPCVLKACDSLSVNLSATLTNTNCSNLISYSWDYGNGSASNLKTPGVINYTTPDTFQLSLTTTYYTYKITEVTAEITGGYTGDIEELTGASNPDPYIIIPSLGFNNTGSSSDVHTRTWTGLNLVVPENNCADPIEIQVWDEDTGPPQHSNPFGSQDDNCGSHYLTPAIPNQVSHSGSNSKVWVTFDTVATSSVTESIDVVVFPHPPVPELMADKDSICHGDSVMLSLSTPVPGYAFNWFMNDTTELAGTDSVLVVKQSGDYKVKITNIVTGCVEWSTPYPVAVGASAPGTVNIIYTGTQEFVSPFPSSGFAVDWYYNGNLVVGQNGKFLPFLGNGMYTAEVYNINFPACRTVAGPDSIVSGINEIADNSIYDVKVFPNPNTGRFRVNFSSDEPQSVTLTLSSMLGQTISERTIAHFSGTFNEELDVTDMAKGIYIVTISTANGKTNSKVVVQ